MVKGWQSLARVVRLVELLHCVLDFTHRTTGPAGFTCGLGNSGFGGGGGRVGTTALALFARRGGCGGGWGRCGGCGGVLSCSRRRDRGCWDDDGVDG